MAITLALTIVFLTTNFFVFITKNRSDNIQFLAVDGIEKNSFQSYFLICSTERESNVGWRRRLFIKPNYENSIIHEKWTGTMDGVRTGSNWRDTLNGIRTSSNGSSCGRRWGKGERCERIWRGNHYHKQSRGWCLIRKPKQQYTCDWWSIHEHFSVHCNSSAVPCAFLGQI